ncbi:hypothetical protein JOS77_15490 [Chromobacterium haemolyticum]|nr:hypothetical protein JOS77_15490 [Chromobacterium haemolyticum]
MSNYHAKYELHYAAGKALRQSCSRTLQGGKPAQRAARAMWWPWWSKPLRGGCKA